MANGDPSLAVCPQVGAKCTAEGYHVRTFYVRTDGVTNRMSNGDLECECVREKDVGVHLLF